MRKKIFGIAFNFAMMFKTVLRLIGVYSLFASALFPQNSKKRRDCLNKFAC